MKPVSCRRAPSSPKSRPRYLSPAGRGRDWAGWRAAEDLGGLKYAEQEMGPAPGTSRPQQAGSWDGSGAPPPESARIKVGYAHSRAADAKRRSDPARAAADLVNSQRGLHVIVSKAVMA